MIKGIYVFRDVVSGHYEFFGTFVNDAVAAREFRQACRADNVPASDLELYCASRIDSSTGRIMRIDDDVNVTTGPEFICKGEKDVSD